MAEKTWAKTPIPNLFKRTASGTYYVRVRVGEKEACRKSLKTTSYIIARARLDDELKKLRKPRPARAGEPPTTLWSALQAVGALAQATPRLKAASRDTYKRVIDTLEPKKGRGVPAVELANLTAKHMDDWWKRVTTHHKPARANFMLMWVKRATAYAVESHAIRQDPAAHIQRVHVPRTKLQLLTPESFALLVADMRGQGNRDAADWVEFATFTGMRPAEANAVKWSDIDRAGGVVHVHGGTEGTKNRKSRTVPIVPRLAELLSVMEPRRRSGYVLSVKSPRGALLSSCDRLGLAVPRRYDFRHMFATRCNESGVDIPSISRWLGHQDGGALVMRTYIQGGLEHDHRAAAKVRF